MPKKLASDQIKTVLTAIQEGPKDWKELKTLKISNNPIPDKNLDRILKDYLEFWGLIFKDKEDGKWSWFLRKRVFENHDAYELALKHSKLLVFEGERPGHDGAHQGIGASMYTLENFASPNKQHTDYQEYQAFFQHIKTGYPPLYQKLLEYKSLRDRRNELMKPAIEKDPNINNLGSLEYDLDRAYYPQAFPEFGFQKEEDVEEKSRSERLHKAFNEEELKRLDSVIKESMSVAEDVVSQLSRILFKLVQGVPLKGYCEGCPDLEVSIKQ